MQISVSPVGVQVGSVHNPLWQVPAAPPLPTHASLSQSGSPQSLRRSPLSSLLLVHDVSKPTRVSFFWP